MSYTNQLAAQDAVLAKIIKNTAPLTFESTKNMFHDLISCILEQQIHYRSSKRIFEKMLHKAGISSLDVYSFSRFEEKGIPTVSFSMQKIETVLRIVDFFSKQTLPWHEMNDDEVRTTLGQIKGVGTWTIDMLLIFTLERPNVFPVDDFQLKQTMISLYNLQDKSLKKQMLDISSQWGNQKSLAVLYIWAYRQLNKNKLIP